jgi:hypothetical protein
MAAVSPQWEAYANWLALDDAARDRLNLPKNKAEYAIANKLSDRTIRRWQNDPLFKALLDKKLGAKGKKGIQAVSVDGTPAVLEEDLEEASSQDSPDDDYQQIKSALVKGAMTGDPKYLDLYFKTYGKEFVAEEVAARTSDLAGLDLSELVVEAASAVGESLLVDYLRSQGYEISRPGYESDDSVAGRDNGEEADHDGE